MRSSKHAAVALPAESDAVSLDDVVVSHELLLRRIRKMKTRAEIAAMHELANILPQGSPVVLKHLARLAVELCDAGSGGISTLEAENDGNQIFRWQALAGELEPYEGGTTPREWSPCGECLRSGKPTLYSYPARFFTYFQRVTTVIVEGLVIPMYAEGQPIGTIWILSHDKQHHFDGEDVRVMTSLGNFVVAALRISIGRGIDYGGKAGIERDIVWGEFISRIVRGDHGALEALIDETKPFVFAGALKILSSPTDAEETTSDVYAQVWKTARRYDPQRYGVLAWLMNIARSRAIDLLRSRARHYRRFETGFHREAGGSLNSESDAANYENRTIVRQALRALSFEQQEAIQLSYFEGYSMSEIASRLDRPLGTVKTHIRTGLIALRRLVATRESHIPSQNPARVAVAAAVSRG